MAPDGNPPLSQSRNTARVLWNPEHETAALIKKAKTDGERVITYDPENRPEVANLLSHNSLCTKEDPAVVADRIGDKGSGELKKCLTEALNEELRPLRTKRAELEKNEDYIRQVLLEGVDRARAIAVQTLDEVREAMNMKS